MISTANLVILVACVSLFSLRAYKLGIWQALLNLAAWVGAYVFSVLLAPYFIKWLRPTDIQGGIAFAAGMFATFFIFTNLIAHGPKLFFPSLREVQSRHRAAGAIFGALNGCLLAFILIWVSSLVMAFVQKNNPDQQRQNDDRVSQAVANSIAQAVKLGMKAAGSEDQKASAIAIAISQPKQASRALSQISNKEFWRDKEVQFLLVNGDIDNLMQNEQFQRLVAQPDLAQMMNASAPEGNSSADSQRYLADQMSSVFIRIQALRADPRFQEIMNDPEVKSMLSAEKPNPVAMIRHPKMQELMRLVFEEAQQESSSNAQVNPSLLMGQGKDPVKINSENQPSLSEVAEPTPEPEIYRWTDENGRVRYTDFMNTPAEMRKAENRL